MLLRKLYPHSDKKIDQELTQLYKLLEGGLNFENFSTDLSSAWVSSFVSTWNGSGGAPAVVDGSLLYRYLKLGRANWFSLQLTMGAGTTVGAGTYTFTVHGTTPNNGMYFENIKGKFVDASTGDKYNLSGTIQPNTNILDVQIDRTDSTYSLSNVVTAAVPVVPAVGDRINLSGFFESAA